MDLRNAFAVTSIRADAEVTIRAGGDLEFSVIRELIQAIESAVDDSVAIVVLDCEQVTFIDSEALKVLIAARRKLSLQGKVLMLGKCSKPVTRVLTLLGLQSHLGCPPDGAAG